MRKIWLVAGLSILAASEALSGTTPIVGAEEGTMFQATCPRFGNLVGLEIYSRDDIDALRLICASARASREKGEPTILNDPAPFGDHVGGVAGGANVTVLRCPPEAPIVVGARIATESDATTGINAISLLCGIAGPNRLEALKAGGSFVAPLYNSARATLERFSGESEKTAGCPHSNFSEYVAVGIYGWSAGDWIHGLGFICWEPGFTARKVGRSKPKGPDAAEATKMGPSLGEHAFCESYAAAAVNAAIENRNLGCGGEGGRWTTDYDRHLNWCLGLNGDRTVPDAETATRAEVLAACRAGKEQ